MEVLTQVGIATTTWKSNGFDLEPLPYYIVGAT
jgi:hypothetical protein